jgi:hypothetical protein
MLPDLLAQGARFQFLLLPLHVIPVHLCPRLGLLPIPRAALLADELFQGGLDDLAK